MTDNLAALAQEEPMPRTHNRTGRARSRAGANAMTSRPNRQKIAGQFAPRLIEMLESPAFRSLSLSAHRILARLEIELAHHGGKDNGRLPVTFDNFQKYGIDRHAIAPAIRECEALGFIEITERGRAGNAEFRLPSQYRLTYRHTGDDAATDEWRRIHTNEDAETIARQARATRPKKQKSNGGIRHLSVGEMRTESNPHPVGEPPTTATVGNAPLLSISGDGDGLVAGSGIEQ
jgi:hypothetical protein